MTLSGRDGVVLVTPRDARHELRFLLQHLDQLNELGTAARIQVAPRFAAVHLLRALVAVHSYASDISTPTVG